MYKLSEHLTYKEATVSQTAKKEGIDNTPDNEQLLNMVELAKNVFEPLRNALGTPLYISSMFRSAELNVALKGAEDSQHCKGEAMDIDADIFGKTTNEEIFHWLLNNVEFDQLIAEGVDNKGIAWVHVSYKRNGKNRKQALIMYKENKKSKYIIYSKQELERLMQ